MCHVLPLEIIVPIWKLQSNIDFLHNVQLCMRGAFWLRPVIGGDGVAIKSEYCGSLMQYIIEADEQPKVWDFFVPFIQMKVHLI